MSRQSKTELCNTKTPKNPDNFTGLSHNCFVSISTVRVYICNHIDSENDEKR